MIVFVVLFTTASSSPQISYKIIIIMTLHLSSLPKTWLFDVDGTLVVHNGYLRPQGDELLPGVKKFFKNIPKNDVIVLLTARKPEGQLALQKFLAAEGIRYDYILTGMPQGERILVNDKKPSGLLTAYAINKNRDADLDLDFVIDYEL